MTQKNVLGYFFTVCMLIILSACGGGGSLERDNDSGGGSTPTNKRVSVSIEDKDGNADNSLSSDSPLTVNAVVTDDGNPVSGELVTFSLTDDTLAKFNRDTATALTNNDGVASIGLIVGQNSGDGLVVATVDETVTGQVGFSSSGATQELTEPKSLEIYASASQLSSSGSDTIELTALVKNERNVLLEGVEVLFSADQGASLTVTQAITDASGMAKAQLSTPNNPANRIITATAQVQTTQQSLISTTPIPVVGTEARIDGPTTVIVNDSATLTVIVEDSDSDGVPSTTVGMKVLDANGNDVTSQTIGTGSVTTASNGQASVVFNSSVSGTFVVQASALNTAGQINITVQQDQFIFLNPPDVNLDADDIPLNQNKNLQIRWLRQGNPFANGNVRFSISRGQVVSADATTDTNGVADLVVSSTNAGIAQITAIGTDSTNQQVSTRLDIEFVATVANSIIVDATPDSIGPDGQTSTISAVVRDVSGNLVKNKVVLFNLSDVSNGEITTGRATTDRSGIATTVYRSNAVSTIESVVVTATVEDNTNVTGQTLLTVGDRAFDISIGTGNLLTVPNDSSLSKEFSIFVTDPDSTPRENQQMTFSAPPVRYPGIAFRKGYWVWNPTDEIWDQIVTQSCANEDRNGNGILDGTEDLNGDGILQPSEDRNGNGILDGSEDLNGDGMLTPGNVFTVPSTATSDANGQAVINGVYAKQFGGWADVRVKVSAESNGSESSESMVYSLGVLSSDLKDEANPPPNSPYGIAPGCDNTN
ncbi:Ig-like domain-containing protein [Aestuariibacter sp. AA17]|uniref:Ig-like domain-containing protein n=1 Tax=Fluctibacter corallii TaxID=2984329 RepID=A0ABT3A9M0_9ALTE|nr:Ig-like domain-containing protein [Aestuariibacter sp. AA17]MCV2885366.1 Ig-like domain-containing protein [Aestuariibacter sp. AA17]